MTIDKDRYKWAVSFLIVMFYIGTVRADYICGHEENQCKMFKTGDFVRISEYYPYFSVEECYDFVGEVVSISKKPTSENIHWITVLKAKGSKLTPDITRWSETYLVKIYRER